MYKREFLSEPRLLLVSSAELRISSPILYWQNYSSIVWSMLAQTGQGQTSGFLRRCRGIRTLPGYLGIPMNIWWRTDVLFTSYWLDSPTFKPYRHFRAQNKEHLYTKKIQWITQSSIRIVVTLGPLRPITYTVMCNFRGSVHWTVIVRHHWSLPVTAPRTRLRNPFLSACAILVIVVWPQ